MNCSSCPPGSISIGGGLRVDNWSEWPNINYNTYCTNFQDSIIPGLPGWQLNDSFLDSGSYLHHSQNSILEIGVNFVRDGTVKFQWRVSAEPGNYF